MLEAVSRRLEAALAWSRTLVAIRLAAEVLTRSSGVLPAFFSGSPKFLVEQVVTVATRDQLHVEEGQMLGVFCSVFTSSDYPQDLPMHDCVEGRFGVAARGWHVFISMVVPSVGLVIQITVAVCFLVVRGRQLRGLRL